MCVCMYVRSSTHTQKILHTPSIQVTAHTNKTKHRSNTYIYTSFVTQFNIHTLAKRETQPSLLFKQTKHQITHHIGACMLERRCCTTRSLYRSSKYTVGSLTPAVTSSSRSGVQSSSPISHFQPSSAVASAAAAGLSTSKPFIRQGLYASNMSTPATGRGASIVARATTVRFALWRAEDQAQNPSARVRSTSL
jgi:hypothetical protein